MEIASLDFLPAAKLRPRSDPGIVITVRALPQRAACLVEGSCRLAKAQLPNGAEALVSGVFITAVQAATQRPVNVSLVGERVVLPSDVIDLGNDVGAGFRCVVDLSRGPVGPVFLHASCFQHVSNVEYIACHP